MEIQVREGMVGAGPLPVGPTAAERAALWTLQIGALAVVLIAVTDRAFELDRFFVPKEAVLQLTALAAGLLALGSFRRVAFTWIDLLLAGHVVLGAISAVFASDRSLAIRSLGISVAGVVIFWVARALRDAGLARALLRVLAIAAVLGAVTSLLQAYGIESDFFSINRAPGGTLGNRNFIAHMAAFGLPIVLLAALRAWRPAGYAIGALGVMIVVITLILTRSRAGWLAFAAVIVVCLVGMILSRPLRRHSRTRRRAAGIVLLIGAGIAAAVLVPNSLRWASENPYLESMTGIANYQEGSGRGRLVQYRQSLRMALDRPLLGVGPGNWSVEYPDYAAAGDPSLSRSQPGATANPWPSSDWVAYVAERGFPATILLAVALLGIVASGLRRLVRARDEDEGIVAVALLATVAATLVAGAFDAVLLLAHSTLLVWAALGCLWSAGRTRDDYVATGNESPRLSAGILVLAVFAVASGLAAARSAAQLSEMTILGLDGPSAPGRLVSTWDVPISILASPDQPSGAANAASTRGYGFR